MCAVGLSRSSKIWLDLCYHKCVCLCCSIFDAPPTVHISQPIHPCFVLHWYSFRADYVAPTAHNTTCILQFWLIIWLHVYTNNDYHLMDWCVNCLIVMSVTFCIDISITCIYENDDYHLMDWCVNCLIDYHLMDSVTFCIDISIICIYENDYHLMDWCANCLIDYHLMDWGVNCPFVMSIVFCLIIWLHVYVNYDFRFLN